MKHAGPSRPRVKKLPEGRPAERAGLAGGRGRGRRGARLGLSGGNLWGSSERPFKVQINGEGLQPPSDSVKDRGPGPVGSPKLAQPPLGRPAPPSVSHAGTGRRRRGASAGSVQKFLGRSQESAKYIQR